MKRILATLAATLLLGVLAVPAQAWESSYSPDVGQIQGIYEPSPQRDYRGYTRSEAFGVCVWVERKNGLGDWNHAGISGYNNCSTTASAWSMNDDTYVSNTYAIRLRRGPYTTNLCLSKSACLAMR